MTGPVQIQTTVVARRTVGGWVGAALSGPPGTGKSGLALALMAQGWRLVADDGALVWAGGGLLWARAPTPTRGLIEVRGLGIVSVPDRDLCRLVLAVTLTPGDPERLPGPVHTSWLDVPLAGLSVRAHDPRAPERVTRAMAEALRRPVSP